MPRAHPSPIRRLFAAIRRRYSILVVSGPESGVRQWSLPVLAVPLLVAIAAFGLYGGGAQLLGWATHRVDEARVGRLAAENDRLGAQLSEMQDLVDSFERKMDRNSEMEQQFRVVANLDAIPEEVRRLGVGGPISLSELSDAASPSPRVREARSVLDRLEELDRRAEFTTANFEELVATIEDSNNELNRVPSISPVRRGWFSSRYGNRSDPFTKRQTFHRGVDFSALRGTPVYATADGVVLKAGRHGTLGLLVEIDHGNGIETRYGHNSKLLVNVGDAVRRGEIVAEVGSTGRSTSPHCHYEIHVQGRHVNPWRYILDGGPQRHDGA